MPNVVTFQACTVLLGLVTASTKGHSFAFFIQLFFKYISCKKVEARNFRSIYLSRVNLAKTSYKYVLLFIMKDS